MCVVLVLVLGVCVVLVLVLVLVQVCGCCSGGTTRARPTQQTRSEDQPWRPIQCSHFLGSMICDGIFFFLLLTFLAAAT